MYPVIELATACLFAVAPFLVDGIAELVEAWLFISLLMIIFVSDFSYMLIPDKIVGVFAAMIVVLRFWILPFDGWWQPVFGAFIGFIVPLGVAVVSRGSMGGGDMKLFAVLGLVLGWKGVLLAFFFSTFYGSLIGGVGLVTGIVKRGKPMPFGPFIVPGALTAYFYGNALLNWYMQYL